jgi:hypothetical protein
MTTTTYPTTPLRGKTVNDLAWLVGAWQGKISGQRIDEYWSPPAGNTLTAMFRWVKEERVVFYEFVAIEPENGGLVKRIKHLDPGLASWEEKEEATNFDLVQLAENEAVFLQRDTDKPTWLVYRLENLHSLQVYFVTDGVVPPPDQQFSYQRRDVWHFTSAW